MAITSSEFWASATAAVAGMCVAGVIGVIVAFWLARSAVFDASRFEGSERFSDASRRVVGVPLSAGAVLCLVAAPAPFAFASPIVPWLFPEIGIIVISATACAIGLVVKGQWRARDVLAAEQQRLEVLFREVVLRNVSLEPRQIEARIAQIETEVDQLWAGEAQSTEGVLAYIRPTRRFFNTPQQGDALDKATIEAYSAADALLEPELLAKLFTNAAAIEQVRAELEDLRNRRRVLDEELNGVDKRSLETTALRAGYIQARAACQRRAALRATNDAKRRIVCQLHACAAYRQGNQVHARSGNVIEQ